MIGRGARHMLEEGLRASGGVPDGAVERLYPELLRFYEAHIAIHSRPFPGVVATLDRLDALGIRTAVVTNKVERLARLLLAELGFAHRMATIIGGDTAGARKPTPPPLDRTGAVRGKRGAGRVELGG